MSSNSVLSASALSNYFDTKISKIRSSTSMAPPPLIAPRLIADHLRTLRPTNDDEIAELLRRAPPKQCKSDPAPTWLVKRFGEQLTPVLVRMCNASISSNHLPTNHKAAIVTPILKKPTMDSLDPASYRPVSNLTFVSKLVEKIVNVRLSEFADQHTLLPHVQSAYRPFHSTETAVAAVHNDMIGALDRGEIGALVLLDMFAAFDTVDHSVLQWNVGSPSQMMRWRGYRTSSTIDHKRCTSSDQCPNLLWCHVVFHRDPSWDQEFSATTPREWWTSSIDTVRAIISTRMIWRPSSMANCRMPHVSRRPWPN